MPRLLLERRLAELDRRVRGAARLSAVLAGLTLGLGLAAVVTIIIRAALPAAETAPPWVLAAALAAPLLAAPWLGGPRTPRHRLAAHLDSLVTARGLVMGLAATTPPARDPAWTTRADRALAHVPWPRADLSRLPLAALAAAAALIALLVPQRLDAPPAEPPPPWALHFERAQARLDLIDKLGVAPPDARARLSEQLDRLRDHAARAGMSQASWDGLDRLERDLDHAVDRARQRLAEALAAARVAPLPRAGDPPPPAVTAADEERRRRDRDRLVSAHADTGDTTPADAGPNDTEPRRHLEQLTREREHERLADLAAGLDALAEAAPGLSPEAALSPEARAALDELLREARAPGDAEEARAPSPPADRADAAPLDPETVARTLDALERALTERGESLGRLASSDAAALEALVTQLARGLTGGDGAGPAAGGPSQSRAAADLALDPTPGAPFAPGALTPLPPGARPNADGSVTLALTARDPALDPHAADALARGSLRDHAATSADARRARVAPRHRGAVSRYFRSDLPATPAKAPR